MIMNTYEIMHRITIFRIPGLQWLLVSKKKNSSNVPQNRKKTQPNQVLLRSWLTISLEMRLPLLFTPGMILLRYFSLLDRFFTMLTLNVEQNYFKQHSKDKRKINKNDLQISHLPNSKLELNFLAHFVPPLGHFWNSIFWHFISSNFSELFLLGWNSTLATTPEK